MCIRDRLEAGYVCARAFILAELAASVEWQLHCVLWPQRGGAEPLSLLDVYKRQVHLVMGEPTKSYDMYLEN